MPRTSKPPAPEFHVADCVPFMVERWGQARSRERPKLVVADPPYNQDEPYDVHDDAMAWDKYLGWTYAWLATIKTYALHPDGSVWLFYPDELVSFIDVFCQKELGWRKRSHIVWYYTFGVCNVEGKNFSRSHTHLLYYSARKTRFTFNKESILVPSARQAVYADKRASPAGKIPDNTWMLVKSQMEAVFTPDMDTWLESRVCGTYKERQKDSPNQLPLPVVERIVLATSNKGDLVYDPFVGSGTTVLAATLHGRRGVGTDISERYITNGRQRVADALRG